MALSDAVFGTPGKTTLHTTPGTRDPGYGFAKGFFDWLPSLMQQQFPTYGGRLDPGLSPTLQDAIRRAQGYAQSGPSEILQGAQGSLGRFMSPNFQNPWNSLFGGSPNYAGVDPNQRIFGGGPAGNTAFQAGLPGIMGGVNNPNSGGPPAGGPPQNELARIMSGMQGGGEDNRLGMMAGRILPGGGVESGGFVNGQWVPNSPGGGTTQVTSPPPGGPGDMRSITGPPMTGVPGGDTDFMSILSRGGGIGPGMDGGGSAPPMPGDAGGGAPMPGIIPGTTPFNRQANPFGGGIDSSAPDMPGNINIAPLPPTTAPPQPQQPAWGGGGNARNAFLDFMGGIDKNLRQKPPPSGGTWKDYWRSQTGRGRPRDQGIAKRIPKKTPPTEMLNGLSAGRR